MKNTQFMRDFLVFYVASLVFFAIGIITNIGLGWYGSLAVPAWTPPEGIIAAIWGTLFVTTVLSLNSFWDTQTKLTKGFRTTVLMYMGNAVLILLWNYLFFGTHAVAFALWVAVAVGISVLALIFRVKEFSRTAAWLLVPYLAWVVYAIAINYAVLLMN